MDEFLLRIKLEVRGPLLTKATAPGSFGVDQVMARNSEGFCFPGTLIKGRVREGWQELREVAGPAMAGVDIDDLLGTEGFTPNDGESPPRDRGRRGRIRFSDLVCKAPQERPPLRYRIQMDGKTRTVVAGQYLVSESPFGPGETAVFEGSVSVMADGAEQAARIGSYVAKGIEWAGTVGTGRTIGLGRLIGVEIIGAPEAAGRAALVPTGVQEPQDRLIIELRLDRPFCIANRRTGQNLFESEAVIPGGVLKGALATRWMDAMATAGSAPRTNRIEPGIDPTRKELAKHFGKIRFSHAFPLPIERTARPMAIPLSTVRIKGENRDLALVGGPGLFGGTAPAYRSDWKSEDWASADSAYGWGLRPQVEIRVRTAIDSSARKAKDEKLFAYEMVNPQGFVWRCAIDLATVEAADRVKAQEQVQELLALGFRDLGKTKAKARVERLVGPAAAFVAMDANAPMEGVWVVTLQTPALLCDPRNLNERSDTTELKSAYEKTWKALCPELELVRYFAEQRLAGGYYLKNQFQRGQEYLPFLLTEAGSVFVFDGSAKAGEYLQDALARGLKTPDWVREYHGLACAEDALWQRCPYVRENGYGEIALNLRTHQTFKPGKEDHYVRLRHEADE